MADKNISQFTEETTRADDQIIYIGKPSGGSFVDRFMTMANAVLGLFNKSTDTTDDITEGEAKFVSAAEKTLISTAEQSANKGAANGYASLGADTKIPAEQLPAIAVTEYLGQVADQTEMLALTGEKGDWCVRTDLGTNWQIIGNDPSLLAGWLQMSYPTAPVISWAGKIGVIVPVISDISNLQTALYAKAQLTQIEQTSIFYPTPSDGSETPIINAGYPFTITEVTTKASAGTCTLEVSINGTPLGGSTNSVSTSEVSEAHATDNAVGIGDDVEITISANSSCENLSISLTGTRILD